MRVYIAGPITGMPEHNFPAFREAATRLRALDFEVVSPIEINGESEGAPGEWHLCMRNDIAALMTCDAVALLPGWQRSDGALLEHYNACKVRIPCDRIENFLQPATGRTPETQPKETSHHE